MKKFAYILTIIIFFSSCRKDIEVDLPAYSQKLVVEASIEANQTAQVFLSYSIPFFGDFDMSQPQEAFVKGARVIVSDGLNSDTLLELDPGYGYYYVGTKVTGQVGKTYYLTIELNGKTYTSSTYIYPKVSLDSIYWKGEKDTLGLIWAHMHEPAGLGNNYRWFAKRLHTDFFYAAPFNSVFDDKFVDGKDFEFAYDRGPQPNQVEENKDDPEAGYYKIGDTVVVKFCTIGRREYEFWYSYYLNKASNGNPFSAPSNLKSFISGDDVIGGFFGYSPSFDTLVISKP